MTLQSFDGFDSRVLRAMEKWPDVPACYGWLDLDRRGAWRLRGEVIEHAGAIAFLSQHYRCDADGHWFVQNGPQRVFVTLEYTPWIYRYDGATVTTHTGLPAPSIDAAFQDEEGNLLLETPLGVGLVDDRDLGALSENLHEASSGLVLESAGQRLGVAEIRRCEVAARWSFVTTPAAADGDPGATV